jgi:peptidoglycan hydrolase-like protein with peptidoglycan-binding domain
MKERIDWAKHFGADFGVDYAQVQSRLNALGANPPLTTDGSWGPKSKAALTAFQQSKGLTADGIPGPITLSALGIPGAASGGTTSGTSTPAASSADAKAFEVAKRAGQQTGMSDREIQYVLTVARGEGHYGTGWGSPSAKTVEDGKAYGLTGTEGVGSNNWGAVQGAGSAGSFAHVDYHADGKPYKGTFKRYSTPEEGFLDMARIILNGGKRGADGAVVIKDAIKRGNLRDAVYAQHANGYFELNPESYLNAVLTNYAKITAGINWPKVLAENGVAIATGIGTFFLLMGAGAVWVFRKQLFG